DLAEGYAQVQRAVEHCRTTRRPTFLHLKTTRVMGHAGTDFEIEWRSIEELFAVECSDPLLRSAGIALESGLYSRDELLSLYEATRKRCFAAAEDADSRHRLTSLEDVMKPLAPYTPTAVKAEATRADYAEKRLAVFGGEAKLPEKLPPRHLAIQIGQALHDLLVKYPQALLFGEDVAQKGGVYTVTKGLNKTFKGSRVFNTLLDETMILGLAQGYANMGMLPIPDIQYLAYFHNACDQIRGEASSLQFFSNDQYRNPMVMRVASLGYQKGFGGHFHNDNSITALRDIPGLVVGCSSRGDDAAMMLRTMMALAKVDGRVCAFLEPIALYMTKDLYETGDGQWQFDYPAPDRAMTLGEGRIYNDLANDLVVFTFGNGVPMALRAARTIEKELGWQVRVVDLRWLAPLNDAFIAAQASSARRILVLDEGRKSAGVGEGVITAIVEGGCGATPLHRVVGADTFTPLAGAMTDEWPLRIVPPLFHDVQVFGCRDTRRPGGDFVETDAVATVQLGAIHRLVGPFHQRFQMVAALAHGHADADAEELLFVAHRNFQPVHAPAQAGGHLHGFLGADAIEQGDKLLAAVAPEQVARAQFGTERGGHGDQRAVAGVVAMAVVEQLEMVQIEEQQGDRPCRGGLQQGTGTLVPGAAIECVGKWIVIGQHLHH